MEFVRRLPVVLQAYAVKRLPCAPWKNDIQKQALRTPGIPKNNLLDGKFFANVFCCSRHEVQTLTPVWLRPCLILFLLTLNLDEAFKLSVGRGGQFLQLCFNFLKFLFCIQRVSDITEQIQQLAWAPVFLSHSDTPFGSRKSEVCFEHNWRQVGDESVRVCIRISLRLLFFARLLVHTL